MSRHSLAKNAQNKKRPKQTPPQKNAAHFFSLTAKKGAAHKKRGAASRTAPTARGEKTGFAGEICASATFHHLFHALVELCYV